MKKRIILSFLMPGIISGAMGQNSIDLTFTAVDNTTYVQLDSIKVMNRTQGGETLLIWPDTVLTVLWVGMPESSSTSEGFNLYQNYPNPVGDQTTIDLSLPAHGWVNLMVTDMLGRTVYSKDMVLAAGLHTLLFTPGREALYFLSATWKGSRKSIKILHYGPGGNQRCSLAYLGSGSLGPEWKSQASERNFIISPGDNLLYIGYAEMLQSGILHNPEESETYTFQLATNIPCPGIPTVEYKGQVYNTIQIFSQCWLKENLNVGEMIPGREEMTDNGVIEKYCYDDQPDSCAKYGGLYQWNEMMQYTTEQGVQGICPPGWHLTTDEEWKVLEGAVDSHYGIGNSTWDDWGWRGTDAGTNLKTTRGWYGNGNGTDLFGFSGLPSGGNNGYWWTSTESGTNYTAWLRVLFWDSPGIGRDDWGFKASGSSVRCLRGVPYIADAFELTFTAVDNASYIQLDSIKVMNRTQSVERTFRWPDTTLTLGHELSFNAGDELLLVGYAESLESGILDTPDDDHNYTFQFATNIPCPGVPTVEYEGQVYNTIQLLNQCWLKENLNVGEMINGTIEQSNNGTIEKYCYNNEPDSCAKYGGLYQWNEMMQYTTQQGAQGICPPGWHLPTDEEWKVLEGAVDSQYGIGDKTWDGLGWRGSDVGTNLKTTSGWIYGGNGVDLYGFSGLPGGHRHLNNSFDKVEYYGYWWSSSEYGYGTPWFRILLYGFPEAGRGILEKGYGLSVRCLRD